MEPQTSLAGIDGEMADLKVFNIEAFTLLGIAMLVTALRCGVRISTVGLGNLWADDYLVILAAGIYAVETGLAYSVGNVAFGLANNSITDEQRASLHPDDREYQIRVLGSKIQLALWATYSSLLWILKASMCTFYYRLTKDLEGYRIRVMIGFGLIISSFVIVQMNLLLSCRPFYHWWQISPDPGAFCHAAISPSLIWTGLSFNLITDFYLIMIPMPMLWKAAMPWPQKAGLITLFSCGLFVTMAAILRVVLLVSDPFNGPQLAASWAVRETFVAIMTTNIPMLFPSFKRWAVPIVERAGSSLSNRSPLSTITDTRFSGAFSLDAWKRRTRSTFRLSASSPISAGIRKSQITVGFPYDMYDSPITRPELSKSGVDIRITPLSCHPVRAKQRMSTTSETSTVSWTETLVNSPQSEGTEPILSPIHKDGYSNNV
ncbi:uncharacterized protein B0J16DRAFT_394641 [Fusarium flagelliforme]|uniref:uncharacterized protein n=1 Tax=Fusarium flagelliforme TaxID=2675880 RepID=UPI001E8CB987|nr:uncharacterized protein B0J16DRAFT_394641 [Fusarium flagelliforme]KAH7192667.1 hypothetical protein B0J16DRAFT_394641 [Fusarium flagelliforme]